MEQPTATATARQSSQGRSETGALRSFPPELGLAIVLIALCAFFALLSPYFLSVSNLVNLGQTVAIVGIVAIGMTMVIISGGIDLSVGSVAALAGVMTSFFWTTLGVPLGIAAVLGVLSGGLVGWLNGFLITRIKINPLITTLAMFSIIRGLAFVISNGQTNQINNDAFKFVGRGAIAGVPVSLIIMLALYLFFGYVLRTTQFGRAIYAVGGSVEASRLAGIPITKVLMAVYIICGLLSGFGGILTASQLALSAPRAAVGLELSVIAAVVLGGTSLSGGKGTLLGTLLGVLILRILDNGLVLLNVSSFYQEIASGAVLLLAVGFDQLRTRRGRRR
jgi:ribose transport system permease protein